MPLDLVLECFECKNNQWTNRWITRNGLGTQLRGKQVYRDRDFLRDASRQFFSTSRNAARAREALGIGGPPMAEALRRLPEATCERTLPIHSPDFSGKKSRIGATGRSIAALGANP
ncbi:hypothetical protein [Pseudomonas protegens]|uniref:hypothetical protein n=1 Tax=Pseudomonas protegens TaxID=380021 RepID=UPI0011B1E6DD|nr:hypothetical protein [Pseudomonas protegens]